MATRSSGWIRSRQPSASISFNVRPVYDHPGGIDEVHGVVGAQRPYHARLRFGEQAVALLTFCEQLLSGAQILFLRLQTTAPAMGDFTEPAGEEAEDEKERDRDAVADVVEDEPGSLDEEPCGDRAEDGGEHTRLPSAQPSREENDQEERPEWTTTAEITDNVTDERGRASSDESDDVNRGASGQSFHSATISPFFLRNCWMVV